MDLTELLKFVTKKEASDLHLKPGRPPLLRVNGRLVPLKTDPLSPKEIEDMVLPILTPYQRDKLQQNYAVDIGYGITGVARFRGNIFLQRGTWTAVFRRIPYQIPQVAALNLANVGVQELAVRGIVEKDKNKIFQAMLLDPLTAATLTIDEIRAMCDEMFQGDKPYLKGYK